MRKPPLILIVDDSPASVEILEARLSALGYDIATASDGEKGLAEAREKQPDLVLLDVMMPKMDGLEVCRRLKADPALAFTPVILITAKADTKDVIAGLDAGGDEYITKPLDHAALDARVKSMLRIKSLHDTVMEQSTQLQAQLRTASKIQSLFWPDIPRIEGGGHIWAVSVPASYVGGDLYDIIPLPDGSVLIYVADVSGKGVPAALIMAALSTIIRSESRLCHEIDRLLENVNKRTVALTAEEGFFATIALMRYWPGSSKMELVIGGHLEPISIIDGSIRNRAHASGIALGIQRGASYEKNIFHLSKGESLLLFTDGVVEAENKGFERFGRDRLEDCLQGITRFPLGERLVETIGHWREGAVPNDDMTILEIWRD
jgi:serine phosphatase RsbU (regulator of sigma subunit)